MNSCSDSTQATPPRSRSRADERQMMRVGIAGAGAVGRSVAQELLDYGHKVLLIEHNRPQLRTAHGARCRMVVGRRVRAGLARGGRNADVRCGDRRDR